jgi:hypothetical protein
MATIFVTNKSTDVSDAELQLWINAIQQQLREDVAPFWGVGADVTLQFVPNGQEVPADGWRAVLLDYNIRDSNLGYHTAQWQSSPPIAYVFTQTTRQSRQTVSRVLSHEIIEMVVDPTDERMQQIDGFTYLVEACDPVHPDEWGYQKTGVLVSNFVTPAYYRITGGSRFDFCNRLQRSCPSVLRGGQACRRDGNGLLELVAAA